MSVDTSITINGRPVLGRNYPYDRLQVGGSFFVPLARSSPLVVKEMVRIRNTKGRGIFKAREERDGTVVTRVDENVFLAPTSAM